LSEFFARESCSRAVIPLPKNLSRKIARFFVSKIGPATGVRNDSFKANFILLRYFHKIWW